jgi:hypothetical protein
MEIVSAWGKQLSLNRFALNIRNQRDAPGSDYQLILPRLTAVTSAMIEIAISAGFLLPI